MNNKQGIKEISYNVQNAVDTETKLICAIKVSQSPTDHYELPDIVKKLMKNINDKPDYVSADTGYHNETSFQFLKKHEIKPLIPDRRQTRENTGRLSENPFHKDHFKYIMDEDVFICPNKHKLEFKQQIIHKKEDDDKPYKIERRYWNYEACKDCEDKDKCCKSTLRQITEFASPEALKTKRKMKTDEYKKLFKKRSSTVEAPFGTLKVFYRMNEMQVKGLKQTENLLTLFAITYNLKILYGFNNSIFDEIEDLNLFKERIQALFNIECEFHEKKSE